MDTTTVGRPVLYRAVLDQDAVQLGWLGGAAALRRARVLLADNVARFFWGPGPECWALSDFPTLLPPDARDGRADWFCEWTFPEELSSERFGRVTMLTGAPQRHGAWLVARPRAEAGRENPRLADALDHLAGLVPIPWVLSVCIFQAYGDEAPLFHPVIHIPLGPHGGSYQVAGGDDLAIVDEVSAIDARDQRRAPFPDGAALLPVFALAMSLAGCANATLREHRSAGAGPFCTVLIDGADAIPVGHFLRRDGRPPRWVAL